MKEKHTGTENGNLRNSLSPSWKSKTPDILQLQGLGTDKLEKSNAFTMNNLNMDRSPSSSTISDSMGPLHQSEITQLQFQHGLNTVQTGRKRRWYQVLLGALLHPFNILLVLLAITSGAAQEFETMGIMFFMVFLSTFLRFYQEWKSEIAVKSLLKFVATKVTVLRKNGIGIDAQELEVPSTDLVPGDWVKLFPGHLVPADLEVVEAKDFHVSQAALTGEAIPVQKHRYHIGGSGVRNSVLSNSQDSTTSSTERILGDDTEFRKRPNRLTIFIRQLFGMPVFNEVESDKERGPQASDLDRADLCFMGSAVVSGTATCRVLHTGSKTHFGRLASELAKRRPQNAFQLGVRRISWIFFITMILMIPPVLLLQGFLVNEGWYSAFLFALSVAVGLTPEMLPMIVSTTLAKGAVEMSRKRCIVKHLDAIINMGGVSVLCTDKTGTLTKSEVTLTRFVNRNGSNSPVPLFLGYINSHFQSVQQNPLDSAIVAYFDSKTDVSAMLGGFRRFPGLVENLKEKFRQVDELPFDFVRRRMSVVVQEKTTGHENNRLLICKGAVEEVLQECTKILKSNEPMATDDTTNVYSAIRGNVETEAMNENIQERLYRLNEQLNEDGFRVIAVAFKQLEWGGDNEEDGMRYSVDDENELTFVGFLAFLDPPKESSREAIKNLLEHNVQVKVLTGDSPLVCRKICNEIGLPVDKIITGKEIGKLMGPGGSAEKLKTVAEECSIFAKLTPTQKSDIVRALKMNGHIVGFLGDGINDAPALTEADCGISVDSGTDICKESADIILLEKDITVVVDSVRTGRVTYGNTLKYIVMAISSNFGNVFSILVASAWLPFEPMASLHILVQNLLYDISQIAIPWDHMDPEFLLVPHRWSMKSVLKFMVMIGPWSSVFDICTFAYMYFYFDIKTSDDKQQVAVFQTAWFTVGLLTQTLIVHMIRTPKIPFIQSWASLPVVVMTVLIMGAGLAVPYIPGLSGWLGMEHLPWQVYPFLVVLLLAYCIAAQVAKVIYVALFKEWY